ncbi:MAG TPA: FAD-dependent oxidoreductase, partial [Vicinamibacteria bacterium]|nr:FAD-dependent oxidoreductase [Vicinamibacteria bacterium]
GDEEGVVNNLAVMTNVSAAYSSDARALVSATVLGPIAPESDATLAEGALAQLREWFGGEVDAWTLVRVDRIHHAQPMTSTVPGFLRAGLYLAGDHTQQPSAQGALRSGRVAAEAILAAGA